LLLLLLYTTAATGTVVYSADSFADTVCVGTHPWYPNITLLYKMVQEAGFRVVRSDISNCGLATSLGLKSMIGIPTYQSDVVNTTMLKNWIATVLKPSIAAGSLIDSIEGPNEPNNFWSKFSYSYNGQGYPDGVPLIMNDTWTFFKNDPVLAKYPIIGASWSQAGPCPFANGTLAPFVDWGDMHPYPTENWYRVPIPYAGVSNYFGMTNDPINTIDASYVYPYVWNKYYVPYWPKPMAFSETGYNTIAGGITETVHGKYIPRLYLEGFRLGIQRTCIYEFYDEGSSTSNAEQNFGIVRFNFTTKPAYTVVQGMLSLLSDPGSTYTPKSINMDIQITPVGNYTKTNFVHNLVFQKRNGVYYVAVWHEIALMNVYVTPYEDLPPVPDLPVLLSFPSNNISTATEYTWSDAGVMSSKSSQIVGSSNISTVAQPQVRIVEISFAGIGTGASSPSPSSSSSKSGSQTSTNSNIESSSNGQKVQIPINKQ